MFIEILRTGYLYTHDLNIFKKSIENIKSLTAQYHYYSVVLCFIHLCKILKDI